jgi:hypothetical protein
MIDKAKYETLCARDKGYIHHVQRGKGLPAGNPYIEGSPNYKAFEEGVQAAKDFEKDFDTFDDIE